jgi:micrococcal nuclease
MHCPQVRLWPVLLAVLAVCLGLGCPSQTGPPGEAYTAQVKDGDTIVLTDGRKVRYLGVDTPELSSTDSRELEYARLAKQVNEELVQGVKLRLEYDVERYDQYNRVLAYLFLPDNRMVNLELVRRGLARVLLKPPNLRFREELVQAQRQAIEEGLGLWQQLPVTQEPYYVGNIKSYRFHRPSCPGAKTIAPGNRRLIKTPLEAYWEGYSPAKDCNP